jgi:hypothetical protein
MFGIAGAISDAAADALLGLHNGNAPVGPRPMQLHSKQRAAEPATDDDDGLSSGRIVANGHRSVPTNEKGRFAAPSSVCILKHRFRA